MKKLAVCLGVIVICLVSVLNVKMMISGRELLSDVRLAFIETVAYAEAPGGGGRPIPGLLTTGGCVILEKIIVGHDADGAPIFQQIAHQGEVGMCYGFEKTCSPYECTRVE